METRPPIPQGPPPSYAFVTRIYKRSLRPAVLVSAFCTALWCLLWALDAFRDIERDRDDDLPEYVPYDIALGSLFAGALAISIFTIFAAATQRIPVVRMAKWLSVVEFIIVMGAQVLSIVLEFKFKGKLLDMCTTANTGDNVIIYHGWWGETRKSLTASEAKDWCNDLIRRDLIADFAWLVVTAVLGLLFLSVMFSFYRQLLDPNFSRAPSNQIRMQAFTVYAPAGPSQQPYGGPRYGEPDYVPPYDPQKLPDYQGAGRHTPEKDETFVPPAGPPPEPTTFTPPAGPPPGAPSSPRPTNPFVRRAEEP